jgi:hypothetical protein
MTSTSSSRRIHSPSTSSYTTESPPLSTYTTNESDTILVATKFSSVSLADREERQQALDRLEMLKTVSNKSSKFFLLFSIEYINQRYKKGNEMSFHAFILLMNLFIYLM